VAEAGGRVTDYAGDPFDLFGRDILASNGLIHDEMREVLAGARQGLRSILS
jgi:myo-inositol-1(or 4)-monophosphatase